MEISKIIAAFDLNLIKLKKSVCFGQVFTAQRDEEKYKYTLVNNRAQEIILNTNFDYIFFHEKIDQNIGINNDLGFGDIAEKEFTINMKLCVIATLNKSTEQIINKILSEWSSYYKDDYSFAQINLDSVLTDSKQNWENEFSTEYKLDLDQKFIVFNYSIEYREDYKCNLTEACL